MLEAFVLHEDGQLSVGRIGPIDRVAVASDDHAIQVALQRRDGESLAAFLQRLDAALKRALDDDVVTDEINA